MCFCCSNSLKVIDCFAVSCPSSWNSLPGNVCDPALSLSVFGHQPNTYLFAKYCQDISLPIRDVLRMWCITRHIYSLIPVLTCLWCFQKLRVGVSNGSNLTTRMKKQLKIIGTLSRDLYQLENCIHSMLTVSLASELSMALLWNCCISYRTLDRSSYSSGGCAVIPWYVFLHLKLALCLSWKIYVCFVGF